MHHITRTGTCETRSTTLWAGAFLLIVAFLAVLFVGPQAAHAAYTAPSFPRLGMWWPSNDTQSVSDRARYDFIGLQNVDADHIPELRAANPNMPILGSVNARELGYDLTGAAWAKYVRDELNSTSTDWMLTQAGSKLSAGITAATTSIPVLDGTKFAIADLVLVDHELMYVNAVAASSLTVTRGQIDPAAVTSHASGARIASVVSVWPGAIEFDNTASCPSVDMGSGPETWRQWNVRRAQRILASAAWDGLTIDCHDPAVSWWVGNGNVRTIDRNRDNVADDLNALNTAWNAGVLAYGTSLRAAVGPDVILLPNGDFRNFSLNGNVFQSFPTASTTLTEWNRRAVGPYVAPWVSYPEICAGATGPNLSMLLTHGTQTNYQLMRFGLTTALLNDGYFMYAGYGLGTSGLWWYDEYDNAGAGRGYLGQPTGAAVKTGTAWRRDFANGIALVNPTDVPVTVALGGSFRKIHGTQAPTVNDGTTVTSVTIPARDGIVLLRITVPAPSGTLTVAAGAAQVVSPVVTLASAVTGAVDMRIDPASGTFGSWVAYTASTQITLAGTPGIKTVRVEYRNATGTIQLADTLELVAPAPVVPAGDFVLAGGASTVSAAIVPVASSATNASEMHFRIGSGSWSPWTAYAASTQVTLPALDGDYAVSAEYRSTSGGVLAKAHSIHLTLPVVVPAPLGTLTVAAGAAQVVSPVVTLASVVIGAVDMRIDPASGTFGSWIAYTPSTQITLAGAPGFKTVRVEYRNATGTTQLADTLELVAPAPAPDPTPTPTPVPTPTPTPVPTVTVTLRASATTLTYGQTTTLRSTLTPASSAALRFESRTAAAPLWVQVATMTADAYGLGQLTIKPLVTTEYRIVLVDSGIVSGSVTVSVKAATTIRSSRKSVHRSSHAVVSGVVTASSTGAVVLQRRTARGHWVSIKRLTKSATGRYSVRVGWSKRGTYSYRIVVSANAKQSGASSKLVSVRVR